MGWFGLSIEAGSTEKIWGIAIGGATGTAAGYRIAGPYGAVIFGIGGGMIGALGGETIDSSEGSIFTTQEEMEGMSGPVPYWWDRG